MKKYLIFLLTLCVLLSSTGCSIEPEDILTAVADEAKNQLSEKTDDFIDQSLEHIRNNKPTWLDQASNSEFKLPKTSAPKIKNCNHDEHHKFDKKLNLVTCKCGAVSYPDLDYDEFIGTLSSFQKSSLFNPSSWGQKKNVYNATLYLSYRGIPDDYLKLAQKFPSEESTSTALSSVELAFKGLGYTTPFVDAYKTHFDSRTDISTAYVDLVGEENIQDLMKMSDCSKNISNSINIANNAFTLYNLLETTDDPADACNKFISTIQTVTGIPSNLFSVYSMVMLDSLQYSLKYFFLANKIHTFTLETYNSAIFQGDDFFCRDGWSQFQNPQEWSKELSHHKVTGTEETDDLPSVEEALECYQIATPTGKELLSKYIVFRLNRVFKEELGLTYQQYVERFTD